MVQDIALTDFVKRRQRIFVDRDAQVIVSYLVVRKVLVVVVNTEHHCAVERTNNIPLTPAAESTLAGCSPYRYVGFMFAIARVVSHPTAA